MKFENVSDKKEKAKICKTWHIYFNAVWSTD